MQEKEDKNTVEQVEEVGPSFREVAVPVSHFQKGTYAGNVYFRGYELISGGIDEGVLRTDRRFANEPRLIIYAQTPTTTLRFDLDTRQITEFELSNNRKNTVGHFEPNSLWLLSLNNLSEATFLNSIGGEPAHLQTITNILVRTSQRLDEQQVTSFHKQGRVNNVALNFGNTRRGGR
jgi:hypothetical protein